MQIEYFDLPIINEQSAVLPLPMKFLHFRFVRRHIRIYYTLGQNVKEETVKFWIVDSNQELPDTFPGKYLATVENWLAPADPVDSDSALHLFIQTPGTPARKPLVIHIPEKDAA